MVGRLDILDRAATLTGGVRDEEYGSPKKNMSDIAAGWSVILDHPVRADQVAMMMAWVKICRAKQSPEKRDHYDDGAAYVAIGGECAEAS